MAYCDSKTGVYLDNDHHTGNGLGKEYGTLYFKILTSFAYGALFISILCLSCMYFNAFVDSHPDDVLVVKFMRFYVGILLLLIVNSLTLALLIADLCQEDDGEKGGDESRFLRTYSYKLQTGFLNERESQTEADMVVTLFKSEQTDFTHKSQIHTKYLTEYPIWFMGTHRKALSTSALQYNSFNMNSTGFIVSCDQFQVKLVTTTFADLGGISDLRRGLLKFVIEPFVRAYGEKPEVAERADVPRGILLIGEEGSGKTAIAEAVINEIRGMKMAKNVNIYKIDGANCFGSFIGSGATFTDLFYYAQERSPSILLVDHIDTLFDRSVLIFLSELSSIPKGKVLVIATACNRDKLHEKLLTPGKFDFIHDVDAPGVRERAEILKIHFRRRGCSVKAEDVDELASLTTTFNGGELEALVKMINQKILEQNNNGDVEYPKFKEVRRNLIILQFEKFRKRRRKTWNWSLIQEENQQ